jgi:glucosamine 6-phosphate synthetase-like amidotransferase/phosphosugar isomerase protein
MMCGISGVIGPKAAIAALHLVLGQLERGTQGCGVAFTLGRGENTRISVLKEPVHPIQFIFKYLVALDLRSKSSIAHNRMPSRGKISYYNTHPFLSCDRQFAIVHNGTTFFRKTTLRKVRKNHRILGDTDSEIACHLLEQYYNMHGDMVTALAELADSEFSGAILVLVKDGRLYGMRKGLEPVHYAAAENSVFIASTETAIRNLVGEKVGIKRLKSGQILEVKGTEIRVHDTDHVSDIDFEDVFPAFCGTQYPYGWRDYFRTAKTLKYFF